MAAHEFRDGDESGKFAAEDAIQPRVAAAGLNICMLNHERRRFIQPWKQEQGLLGTGPNNYVRLERVHYLMPAPPENWQINRCMKGIFNHPQRLWQRYPANSRQT